MRKRAIPQLAGGSLLAVISIMGIVHGVRGAISEVSYFQARYGHARDELKRSLDLSGRAFDNLPYHYYACIWAGKQAFYEGGPKHADTAARWADRGMALNPYNSEIVHLKTEVTARQSVEKAIAIWKPYREWHFWEPFNHFVLFDLYLRADNIEAAEEVLYWLNDTKFFHRADDMFQRAL